MKHYLMRNQIGIFTGFSECKYIFKIKCNLFFYFMS